MTFPMMAPKRLLPLLIFMAVLMVGVRLNDLWGTLTHPQSASPVRHAQASTAAEKKAENNNAERTKSVPDLPPAPERKAEAALSDDSSASAMDLVKHLSTRRAALDAREQEMETREALTKVAEQRIDQKIKEMETLRTQLQNMVNQIGAAQQTQIENLVKIYETMKAKEAARIFETLELPVLMGVIQRMKPQRTAVIMAEMDPLKAKEITVALTKQDQLPKVK